MPQDNENSEVDAEAFPREREPWSAVDNFDQSTRLQEIFEQHGLSVSEASRISLRVFAAALPLLARGGNIVFREPGGAERAYCFPLLPKRGSEVAPDQA